MKGLIPSVFAIFAMLTLTFGFLQLNAQSNLENTSNQEVKNLSAFAKSFGYVRFFYPNARTEDFNWDAFLVYGIQQVKSPKSDNELQSVLSDLFSPIAPYAIFSNDENTPLKVNPISQGDSIRFWQHCAFSIGENSGAKFEGNDIKILVSTAFDSSKMIKPNNPLLQDQVQFDQINYFNSNKYYYPENFRHHYNPEIKNEYILEKQPNPSQSFSSKLANNLWIKMPIVLDHREAEHLNQEAKFQEFSKTIEEFYADEKAIFQENDVWYADFILTWNAIHHLYPYRKRSERMFDFQSSEQLALGLKHISSNTDKKAASLTAVKNYVSLFRDGHARVFRFRTPDLENQNANQPKRVWSWLPFYRIYSQGKVYVLKSFDPKIKNGDEILEINNKEVSDLLESAINRRVGSPQSKLINAVNSLGSLINASTGVVKLKRANEILTVEVNTIPPKEYTKHFNNPFEHKAFEYPAPKTIYINPSLLSQGDLSEKLDEILEAEHLIFDLRDYPQSLRDIFEHLPVEGGLFKGLISSYPLNMYPNQEQRHHIWQSALIVPKKPFIKAKITVLIGSSIPSTTRSRGETFASNFKYAGATLIGDSNSVGASGGIDSFTTPGRIQILLTTSYTVRQNGEEMQTVGIVPDILVKQNLDGLKEGKDQVYEAALKRIKQE